MHVVQALTNLKIEFVLETMNRSLSIDLLTGQGSGFSTWVV